MKSISSPLGLASRISKPDLWLDAVTVANLVICLGMMLTLLFDSRFVYAPGITVAITDDKTPVPLNLPVHNSTRLTGVITSEKVTLLALKQDDLVIYDGRIRNLAELEKDFAELASLKKGANRGILLVKADGAVTLQTFFEIESIARRAGFTHLQLAGESSGKNSRQGRR